MNPSTRRALALAILAAATASSVGLSLVACESATNLDVSYGDAQAALESSTAPDADAGTIADPDAEGGVVTPPVLPVFAGCPCDESEGQGCCLPAKGEPFCTSDTAVCVQATGTHLKCVRPDPSTESNCCWRQTATGAITALAASCDGGVPACTNDGECAGTGKACKTATCFNKTITIGACSDVAPTCPQP